MTISGIVLDKTRIPITEADVIMLDQNFEEIYRTSTNQCGYYTIEKNIDYCPFLVFIKDYREKNLEYWCQNIYKTEGNIVINGIIDKIEIYGLTCFEIKGAEKALTVYFQPMSLTSYKINNELFPNISEKNINISINDKEMKILTYNVVEEYSIEKNMKAILCQIELPNTLKAKNSNILEILISDNNGDIGNASIFF